MNNYGLYTYIEFSTSYENMGKHIQMSHSEVLWRMTSQNDTLIYYEIVV